MSVKYSRPLKQGTMMVYCLLLLAGCTTSYALLDSIRPAYRVGGEATQVQSFNSYDQGKQLFIQGKYGLALEAFKQANAENPNSVNALNGIAACYDQIKRHDLATSYYYKALKIQPDSVKTLSNLGYSYILQGRYTDASKVLQIALAHEPDNARAAHNLSLANSRLPQQQVPEVKAIALSKAKASEPAAAAPVVSEPVAAAPVVSEPVAAAPVASEPVAAAPVASEPVAAAPVASEPVAAAPVASEPVAVAPAVSEPVAVAPAVSEPVAVAPAVSEPVAAAPVASEPVAAAPVASEPVAAAPAVSEPAAAAPAVSEPVAAAPAVPEPVAAAPAVPEPVAAAPVVSEPVAIIPVRSDPAKSTASATPDQQPMKVVVLSVGNRIEISNGNGRTGMAKALTNFLKSRNEWVWKITNSRPFNQERTTLYYLSGRQIEAEQLAIKVPAPVVLKETTSNVNNSDLRLVIGHDFIYKSENEIHMMAKVQDKVSMISAQMNNVLMPARLEIANGNGRNGMARLVTNVLARHGQTIRRITNADSFDYASSVIYYMPDHRKDAEKVAAMLPVRAELKEMDISHRRVDIRIVIGKDLLEAEDYLTLLSSLGHA
ncbi:Tetratricopeptide repeat-containing protein [Mariprofundus ferrinatatus]|uniref:Tetratricopeptide repeat-containing protein n=1 Tax=Mariprofundus ferrinatatus TaxID=1921087 RepID=A0A2K8L3B3_9PROT|nr:LytR C-terminal domain-containing protein [Mariprofundus ferrinatatus]ATX81767.1 Tetratricopeptide repeat-containing protein [Mariprofundus ferrinatatus]